jgi:hypothetical protein
MGVVVAALTGLVGKIAAPTEAINISAIITEKHFQVLSLGIFCPSFFYLLF